MVTTMQDTHSSQLPLKHMALWASLWHPFFESFWRLGCPGLSQGAPAEQMCTTKRRGGSHTKTVRNQSRQSQRHPNSPQITAANGCCWNCVRAAGHAALSELRCLIGVERLACCCVPPFAWFWRHSVPVDLLPCYQDAALWCGNQRGGRNAAQASLAPQEEAPTTSRAASPAAAAQSSLCGLPRSRPQRHPQWERWLQARHAQGDNRVAGKVPSTQH